MQDAGIVVHLPVNFCIVKFFLEDFLLEHLQGEMHFDHNPTRKRGIDLSLTRRVMIERLPAQHTQAYMVFILRSRLRTGLNRGEFRRSWSRRVEGTEFRCLRVQTLH